MNDAPKALRLKIYLRSLFSERVHFHLSDARLTVAENIDRPGESEKKIKKNTYPNISLGKPSTFLLMTV